MDHKNVDVALGDKEKGLSPESAETMKLELSENPAESTEETVLNYLVGWRLHVLSFTLCISIFLVNFEITVVSTSLVSITNDLGGFGRSTWVVTAYLFTYTGFMVIFAKISDIFGRKSILFFSLLVFTIFSGGCGAAQNITELIALRTFQGLGGSGVYSMVMVILFEMVPPEKYPLYSVFITALFAISLVTGPLVGGVICANASWRWVFLLNVPAGCLALLLLVLTLPTNFPHHGTPKKSATLLDLRRIDYVGALLMLAILILVIAGFEEASNFNPWRSSQVVIPLVVAAPLLLAFLAYERQITMRDDVKEPVLPWRFFKNRVLSGILITAFLVGAVFTTLIIQIPLRFQAVNRLSSFQAGLRLIPMTIMSPIGATLCAVISGKCKLPPIYLLMVSSMIQVIALAWLAHINPSRIHWSGQYGFQAMAGIGLGLGIGAQVLLTPFVIEKRDLAVATAAVVQFRMLGGAVGLALCTAVANGNIQSALSQVLSPVVLQQIFDSVNYIDTLSLGDKLIVQNEFLHGFNLQMYILLAFAATLLPASLLIWKRPQVQIA